MRKTLAGLAGLLLFSGCFEILYDIDLKKDLSGTAKVHLAMNMEPAVMAIARFQKSMEGKSGPLTDEELAAAKSEFGQSMGKGSSTMPTRAELEKELPAGVKLLDLQSKEDDLRFTSDVRFSFDDFRKIVAMRSPKTSGNTPFRDFELVENDDTITLHVVPPDPTKSARQQAGGGESALAPELEQVMKEAFAGMHFRYSLTAPFQVVSTNATTRNGNTLVWEYDYARFDEIRRSGKLEENKVRVTYKK